MKVAVVSMPAVLADLDKNMKTAEEYIRYASSQKAQIIVLPEFFNTGFAVNPKLADAILPKSDIEDCLSSLSKKYNIAIGGSYLNYDPDKANIFNTFGLFFPEGVNFFHSKDIPTAVENLYYASGDDNSSFCTPLGNIGVAMCWEQLRYNTVRRMYGKIDLLLTGSCWWGFTPEDGPITYRSFSGLNKELALNAPSRLAGILGVPVVHSSHIGSFPGSSLMDPSVICNRPVESRSSVYDAFGESIFEADDKPGCYICDVVPGQIKEGERAAIPDDYWITALPPQLENGFNTLNRTYHEMYVNKFLPSYIKNHKLLFY